MTAQTETSRDDLIARNLAAVETHFHNETPETEATGAPATYLWCPGPGPGLRPD